MVYDLHALGARVRRSRADRGMTSKALAQASGVSVRFLSELENGRANISVGRLSAIAEALSMPLVQLVDGSHDNAAVNQRALAEELLSLPSTDFSRVQDRVAAAIRGEGGRGRILALLGVRGSGKTTVGASVAQSVGVPFIELDALVEEEAGLSLSEIFAIHGEAYYRDVEMRVLQLFLERGGDAVLATGGSIVTHPAAWSLLRRSTTTVWLRADAQALWERVVAQGDLRPMRENPNAFSQLEALVESRSPLYAQADVEVETTEASVEAVVAAVAEVSSARTQ